MSEGGEKQFAPTAKKRRDAAQKGDVLRSRELATAATVCAGLAWLVLAGPWLMDEVKALLVTALIFDAGAFEGAGIESSIARLPAVFAPVIVLGTVVPLASLAAQLGFGDGRWVGQNVQFKASRISPLNGLKRMFGMQGLIEMGKGLLKVTLLGAIAAGWGWMTFDDASGLGRATLADQLSIGWNATVGLTAALAVGLMIIAAIDLPIQWIRREGRLRMSHQEMKDEAKQTEGSAETRAARRQRQRDIAKGAIAGAMREAQFVITNPTHFAVAMTYDPQKAPAPVVLAKGRGEKALAMRELAAELGVPTLEYPALARSIYYTTREQQVIRAELFAAVASVVAFILSVRRGENPQLPTVVVPQEMQFDANGRQAP